VEFKEYVLYRKGWFLLRFRFFVFGGILYENFLGSRKSFSLASLYCNFKKSSSPFLFSTIFHVYFRLSFNLKYNILIIYFLCRTLFHIHVPVWPEQHRNPPLLPRLVTRVSKSLRKILDSKGELSCAGPEPFVEHRKYNADLTSITTICFYTS
jgi:hypothetical protein